MPLGTFLKSRKVGKSSTGQSAQNTDQFHRINTHLNCLTTCLVSTKTNSLTTVACIMNV